MQTVDSQSHIMLKLEGSSVTFFVQSLFFTDVETKSPRFISFIVYIPCSRHLTSCQFNAVAYFPLTTLNVISMQLV